MQQAKRCEALIIGTGIIGAMSALYMQNEGFQVTFLERNDIARGASSGNAGFLAFSEIAPMAAPGIMRKAPKWLFDPLGPLSIPPSYAIKIAPWLYKFWKASSARRYGYAQRALKDLNALAKIEMAKTLEAPELSQFVSTKGTLDLYDNESSFKSAAKDWAERARAGTEFREVTRDEIDELQPGLSPQFKYGYYTPTNQQISDPYELTKAIVDLVISRGGLIRKGEAVNIVPVGESTIVTLLSGEKIDADKVVLAAGAWSKKLAQQLGNKIPLETERGYNTTLPLNALSLNRQIYFNDHGFVMAPLGNGVRIGGAVELGGLKLPANFKRSEAMLKKAKRFFPTLNTDNGKQWMGFRPSLPDSLPVIGTSTASGSVIYAFGHGHLGLTQSAATARLVTDLAKNRESVISLDPYRANRF